MTSNTKQIAIAVLPKFSGFFSLIGSGFIVYDILCNHFNIEPDWFKRKKKNSEFEASSGFTTRRTSSMASASRGRSSRRFAQRKTLKNSAYYRLMLSMSVSDFIVSGAWFCTTWPIPKDDEIDQPSSVVFGNVGNRQTCTAQAFFIQLGIITPFYNAILACYYYLTIRREWKEEEFKCKIEYAGHFITISWGLCTSIAGIAMELFNNSNVWCWIAPYPGGCSGDDCLRGKNAKAFRWAFYYGPLWVMIFLVALFMSLVYAYVRGLDNKMNQYTAAYRTGAARSGAFHASNDQGSGELGGNAGGRRKSIMARTFSTVNTDTLNEQRRQRRNERSKAVANQGLFYAGTFALVWVFGTIVRAMQLANKKPPWAILFLFAVFTPSQGFFNFLVYVRPRLIKKYEERKKKKEGKRNSKTGSSFNSDILHVSGVSGPGSSSEMTGNQHNRDGSTRSDFDLSEPFKTSREFRTSKEIQISKELRTSKESRTTSEFGTSSEFRTSIEFSTPEPKPVRENRRTPGFGKVRFAAGRKSASKKKVETTQSEFSSKVRFLSQEDEINSTTSSKNRRKEDTYGTNTRVHIAAMDRTPLEKDEDGESPTVEISEPFDDKSTGSDDTIDPDLLNNEHAKGENPKMAKQNGGNKFGLHNATIDLATGQVRTRKAARIVSPPSYD